MIYENEKIWFQFRRLWKLFPITLAAFLYLFCLCQESYFAYSFHKEDYRIEEGEVVGIRVREERTARGSRFYRYDSEVKIANGSEEVFLIAKDRRDSVGRRIKVAVHKENPGVIRRTEWLWIQDSIEGWMCGFGIGLLFLGIGKILSCYKIPKVYERLDKYYAEEVRLKRNELSNGDKNHGNAVVTRICRGVNETITAETVQVYYKLPGKEQEFKSPKFIGHICLREGDLVPVEMQADVDVNWSKYIV